MHTQRPAAFIDETVERTLLEAAIVAPSLHNSQPWQFVVGPRRIELYADPARQLQVSDGSGRSLLVSCGAALFNLRVAAEHLGFHPRVRLLPNDNPILVATLDVDHRHPRPGLLEELYPAIWRRRTNRYPFLNRTPSPVTLSRLSEAVSQENALLRISDEPAEVSRIRDLLHHAESVERRNPAGVAERAAWVTSEARQDGIPVESLGPVPRQSNVVIRDLANGLGLRRPSAPFEVTPTVAVLSTMHDEPLDWVRAGQALQRALLVATNEGLVASFMNQPIEQDELRGQVRSPLIGIGHTQMLMRIGYGVEVPPTPRRPLAEVVRRAESPESSTSPREHLNERPRLEEG